MKPASIQALRNFAGNVQVEGNNAGQSDIATLGEFGCQASPGLDTTASATTMDESKTLAKKKQEERAQDPDSSRGEGALLHV